MVRIQGTTASHALGVDVVDEKARGSLGLPCCIFWIDQKAPNLSPSWLLFFFFFCLNCSSCSILQNQCRDQSGFSWQLSGLDKHSISPCYRECVGMECLTWERSWGKGPGMGREGSWHLSSRRLSGYVLTHCVARQSSQVGLWPHYARNSESKNLTSQEKEWVWIREWYENRDSGRGLFPQLCSTDFQRRLQVSHGCISSVQHPTGQARLTLGTRVSEYLLAKPLVTPN